MKNKLLTILLFVIIVCANPVLASDIDISSMETKELVQLKNEIVDELIQRTVGSDATIGNGGFLVGEDIKAGSYTFVSQVRSAYITVFDSKESFESALEDDTGEGVLMRASLYNHDDDPDNQANLNLHDGEYLYIRGTGILTVNTSDWVPEKQ